MKEELRNLARQIKPYFRKKDKGICPFCNLKVDSNSLRDELSKKEFKISGLCQRCQDETFGI